MARFCITTGYTPETYWNLTLEEYQALSNAVEERNQL
jgi:hypothetical protein